MLELIIGGILFIFLMAWFVFFVAQFYHIIFLGHAPFISTKPKVVKKILDEINLKDDAIIYELGCGRAPLLRALSKKYPKAKLFGVEYSFWPYLVAQIQDNLTKNNITILRNDMFTVDLSKADAIYCYLNLKTMAELEEKFKKECKPGTTIISHQFYMPNLKPEKTITVDEKGDRVYFYKIS